MRFFRNFHDLRGRSRGNRRSNLIFMGGGGGGGTIYSVCSLNVSNAGTARHKSSQASGVYTMSTFTSIYYTGMRLFRNFPDLRGHSRGNPRSGLIFMGGYHLLCVLADCQQCWNGTTYILTINLF